MSESQLAKFVTWFFFFFEKYDPKMSLSKRNLPHTRTSPLVLRKMVWNPPQQICWISVSFLIKTGSNWFWVVPIPNWPLSFSPNPIKLPSSIYFIERNYLWIFDPNLWTKKRTKVKKTLSTPSTHISKSIYFFIILHFLFW